MWAVPEPVLWDVIGSGMESKENKKATVFGSSLVICSNESVISFWRYQSFEEPIAGRLAMRLDPGLLEFVAR